MARSASPKHFAPDAEAGQSSWAVGLRRVASTYWRRTLELATPEDRAGPTVAADRPRVLHVITRFASGGSEQRLVDMVRALPDHEHVVAAGELTARERLSDVRTLNVPSLVREVAPRKDFAATVAVARLVRRVRPTIVVTHQSKAGIAGRLGARLARFDGRLAHSLSMSAFDEAGGRLQRTVFRLAERALVRSTDLYLCSGHDLARQYCDTLNLPTSRVHVVRSSLDLAPFMVGRRTSARQDLGLDARPTLIYVGSFDERKGVRDLPEVCAAVRDRVGALNVLLIGDGALLAGVIGRMSVLDGVIIVSPGHVTDVARYMVAADVVCLPSRAEGLPQVLVQAAAADVPFVAYDVCGVRELLESGATGVCIPRGDRSEFVRAVIDILQQARTGHFDHDRLCEWSAPHVTTLYRSLLLSPSRASPLWSSETATKRRTTPTSSLR